MSKDDGRTLAYVAGYLGELAVGEDDEEHAANLTAAAKALLHMTIKMDLIAAQLRHLADSVPPDELPHELHALARMCEDEAKQPGLGGEEPGC